MTATRNVLIAGIGGASLGSEIAKCLARAQRYDVYGCDISPFAAGHYSDRLRETFVVDPDHYVPSVLALCRRLRVACIVPGGEAPTTLLASASAAVQAAGIRLACNAVSVIDICSDKARLFARLRELGIPIPLTVLVREESEADDLSYPCVVKPATGSGGSAFVFLAATRAEGRLYVRYLLDNGQRVIAQEYVPVDDGEFTVGVLSLPNGRLVGSVALRRLFHAKLSVSAKTRTGLISSGYSQGLIDDFPEIRAQAEGMAAALGSMGPLNVQGRVRDGRLVPFEINPRFSASTYLRAMAGFNEIDLFLQWLLHGAVPAPEPLRSGYYLRDLAEVYVEAKALKT